PREEGYALAMRASQAILDPDAVKRGEAENYLRDAYTNRWRPQQQTNGNYLNNQIEGGVVTATNGNAVITGTSIPQTFCTDNTVYTEAGTGSVTTNAVIMVGSGTSWSGSAGKTVEIYGTRGGQYYIFQSRIASAPTNASLILAYPYDG